MQSGIAVFQWAVAMERTAQPSVPVRWS